MLIFWIVVTYIFYVFANILIAASNVDTVHYRQHIGNPKQIEHTIYGAIYGATLIPFWFIFHNVWLIGSLGLLHLSVFPVAYNLYMELPAFHLSKTSKAITDRLMVKTGLTSTEKVNLVAQIISMGLLAKAIV